MVEACRWNTVVLPQLDKIEVQKVSPNWRWHADGLHVWKARVAPKIGGFPCQPTLSTSRFPSSIFPPHDHSLQQFSIETANIMAAEKKDKSQVHKLALRGEYGAMGLRSSHFVDTNEKIGSSKTVAEFVSPCTGEKFCCKSRTNRIQFEYSINTILCASNHCDERRTI